MRLGRRLSTGIAEDPPAPTRAEPAAEPATEPAAVPAVAPAAGTPQDEVRREYAEASER